MSLGTSVTIRGIRDVLSFARWGKRTSGRVESATRRKTTLLVWTSVVLREFNIAVESLWREVWSIMIES